MLKRTLLPIALAALSASAHALLVFSGTDIATGPGDARPNSNAAAAAFDTIAASMFSISAVTFENMPLGTFNTISPKPGLKVVNGSGADTAIDATPTDDLGYNTTFGGRKYLRFWQSFGVVTEQVDFVFDEPINSFGAYFTGAQENFAGIFTVEFTDSHGNPQSLLLDKPAPGNDGTAATQFLGFVDDNFSGITKVSVVMRRELPDVGGRDLIGIDDVRYTNCDVIPEPGTMMALGLGLSALVVRRRAKS